MKKAARVLVADDDHDIADSLAAVIEARGHSVSVAYSGGEATRLAHEKRFDIGFLDIMMPGRNGVECLFDIKRLQPGMTVYMMTGFSVADLIEQALGRRCAGRPAQAGLPAGCLGTASQVPHRLRSDCRRGW